MGLPEKVYERAPLWLQNTMVTARGVSFRLHRYRDAEVRATLRELEKSQWWPLEKLLDDQLGKLKAYLCHVQATVPYYRRLWGEIGFDAAQLSSVDDLRQIPMVTKQDVRGHETEFVSDRYDAERLFHMLTSGTTGTPLNIYETRSSWSKRIAYVARLRQWAGLANPQHPRRVQITGRMIVPNRQPPHDHTYWRHNWADNSMLLSCAHTRPEVVPDMLAAIRRFKPDLIDGIPSVMLVMARVGLAQGVPMPRPKAIIATSETLPDEHKEELESAYGCRVFNQYAASEPSCFWGTCEHGTMHISPEYGVSEILREDGEPAQPGEIGEIVVTSALNDAYCLVRYQTGDQAEVGPLELCACGRQQPRITRVLGRIQDRFYFPGRGYVSFIADSFKGLSGIIESQVVQDALDHLTVLIVPDATYTDAMSEKLRTKLRLNCGAEVEVAIKLVEDIPRGPNGKFYPQLSLVKHLYPAGPAD